MFSKLFTDESDKLFDKPKCCTSSLRSLAKYVNNKWFEENCRKEKAAFKSARNEYSHTKTPESRLNFTKARTKYNQTKRVARQKYRLNAGTRLECIAKQQPRNFWKTVKNSYKKVDDKPDSLSINELFTYFKDLFGETNTNVNNDDLSASHDSGLNINIIIDEVRKALYLQNN